MNLLEKALEEKRIEEETKRNKEDAVRRETDEAMKRLLEEWKKIHEDFLKLKPRNFHANKLFVQADRDQIYTRTEPYGSYTPTFALNVRKKQTGSDELVYALALSTYQEPMQTFDINVPPDVPIKALLDRWMPHVFLPEEKA